MKENVNMSGKIGAILLAIVMVIGLICTILCLTKIPAGYVGVVYNMNGGVDGEILTQGVHVVSPTKKVTTYSIGLEQSYLSSEKIGDSKDDESFSIPTSDGKTVQLQTDENGLKEYVNTIISSVSQNADSFYAKEENIYKMLGVGNVEAGKAYYLNQAAVRDYIMENYQ